MPNNQKKEWVNLVEKLSPDRLEKVMDYISFLETQDTETNQPTPKLPLPKINKFIVQTKNDIEGIKRYVRFLKKKLF